MYKEILKNTFASVFDKKEALFKALLIPTILLVIFDFLTSTGTENVAILIATLVFTILINITIAISTHRILLLGNDSVPTWGLFKFTSRELSFLLKTFGLVLIMAFPVILIGFIFGNTMIENIFVPIGVAIIIFTLLSRLSLVFPAIAVDKKMTFKDSWDYTKDHKVLCFITIVLFPALFSIVFGLVYGVVITFLSKMISPNLSILYSVLSIFITVFVVSALSNTYKHIMREESDFDEDFEENLEEVVNPDKIYKLSINDYDVIELDANHEITFESLKSELMGQYEKLGFTVAVVDEVDSWVVKQHEDGEAYVALRVTEDEFQIQTFDTEEPVLEILRSE